MSEYLPPGTHNHVVDAPWNQPDDDEADAAQERAVNSVIDRIERLEIDPATLDMLLGALLANTKQLPAQNELIAECVSFVECLS
jgi:hypothetical protein